MTVPDNMLAVLGIRRSERQGCVCGGEGGGNACPKEMAGFLNSCRLFCCCLFFAVIIFFHCVFVAQCGEENHHAPAGHCRATDCHLQEWLLKGT